MSQLPTATKWILDAAGKTGRSAVESIVMVLCHKTDSKGTGFVLANGQVITNEHVVRDCTASDISGQSPMGGQIHFTAVTTDPKRDLAVLEPTVKLDKGLSLDLSPDLAVGTTVTTWGFPLGYNGPAPLLSVGYLAGFTELIVHGEPKQHLVVNGAFNPGNSGGPLFRSNDDGVIGVVVSKHVPITQFHQSALDALGSNKTGVVFTATDPAGDTKQWVESQLVADLLNYYRSLTQVMIGEAIGAGVVSDFLEDNGFSVPTI